MDVWSLPPAVYLAFTDPCSACSALRRSTRSDRGRFDPHLLDPKYSHVEPERRVEATTSEPAGKVRRRTARSCRSTKTQASVLNGASRTRTQCLRPACTDKQTIAIIVINFIIQKTRTLPCGCLQSCAVSLSFTARLGSGCGRWQLVPFQIDVRCQGKVLRQMHFGSSLVTDLDE